MLKLEKFNSEKLVYALLFLLPIFAVSVRHWVSNIFGILSLVSLVLLYINRKQHIELLKEEKILLWGFAVYFGVFILTSIVNGWGPLQTRYLGVEIRFLLFIPLYLVIRRMEGAAKYLIMGAVLGVIFTAYDCFNEVYNLKRLPTYRGVYSPLFAGPVILLLTFLSLPYFLKNVKNVWLKVLILMVVTLGLFVVAKTGARNAYLAAIVLYVLFVIHQFKAYKRLALISGAVIVAYGAYASINTINSRVNLAFNEYKAYFAYEDPAKYSGPLTSVGTRLEMWRATPIFFKDNPVFGSSRGSYSAEVKKYIDAGLVHPEIGKHGHPHNLYSEALISKGMLGILSLLWVTVYPLFMLVSGYRNNLKSSFYGITLIVGYMVLSLTDASTFIKGNYSSIYIIFLAVLFSYYIQEIQKPQKISE